ncbi:MAG: 1-deoxy-D-xylulose-5-phosphate synthase [Lachnospiraceae bacterium]
MILDRIDTPEDLKSIQRMEDLEELAQDIRNVILAKASTYGGHVGSNLGLVETTIALHYVFDSPKDRFVFDVSHQCYTHKILTGRKNAYIDPIHYSDVSGFTDPKESEHDCFKIGHSATSISLACGLAKAREQRGTHENIIAVIGDGALGGGEALEGLNFAGTEIQSNLIIIVNDNQMSIAENHGGLYKHLALLRESNGESECNIFKALGFAYKYVKEGNDIESLISIFQDIKDIPYPIVIHINTVKGKGYPFAEKDKENWHWRRPFDLKTGELISPFSGESYDRILNDYLFQKMKNDKMVVAYAAGTPLTSAFTFDKRKEAGTQFVDVGIAEEHAIAMIAGMAKAGGKPVFTTDSTFYQRVYDQVFQELCINCLPATMLFRNATVWGMTDETHLGFFDIPIFSNIPNLVYLAPTNKQEYLAMLDWSIEQNKYPVAIKIPRFVMEAHYPVQTDYDILNRYQTCVNGQQIAILALGDFFQIGEELLSLLGESLGINATLINPRYASGIDEILLNDLKIEHSLVITLEDGVVEGGFGQKIAGFYSRDNDMRVLNYGLAKEFVDRYKANELLERNRLKPSLILEDILALWSNKQ